MTLHALVNNQPKQIVEGFIGVNNMPRSIKAIYIGNEENKPVLCFKRQDYNYVSFGDSIAAGHAINDDWATNYGTGSQYGEKKNKNAPINTETEIVSNSYTDLINKHLISTYGVNRAKTKSFAHSGDKVEDLINMLSDEIVKTSLEEADIVTVCIGANDILGAALANLESYINNGNPTLDYLDGVVGSNIATLNDDSSPVGYMALFNKMYSINPNAQYVFMTIYNPIKYLWLEDGKNGFFKPIFGFINNYLQLTILGFEVDEYLGDELLKQSMVRTLFNRVNGLGDWAEKHLRNLNEVLKNKIDAYQTTHPNFMLVNSKSLFESYPDRPVSANKHYNDLLNIEYTRGYDTAQMDWGKLWGDNSVSGYWSNLARHLWNGFDVGGFATELVTDIVTRVVVPDVDPHPETYGHNVLYRLFAEALGWQNLEKRHYITFNPNGGNGSSRIQEISYIGDIPYFANLDANEFTRNEGYRFIGWNTKPDGSGISYSDRQTISMSSDITLYAQWSNIYTLRFKHSNQTNSMGNDETGHKECYALWIAGSEMPDFGRFDEGSARDYSIAYGTRVGVIAKHYIPEDWLTSLAYTSKECRVLWNDTTVASGVGEAIYEFSITCDTTVDFRWKLNATTSGLEDWEDCHITTSLI